MSKRVYLLILMVLSTYLWDFSFLNFLGRDLIFVLQLFWGLVPFLFFKKNVLYKQILKKYNKYTVIIFFGVFLSMVSSYYFWDQSFYETFISQRFVYLFISLSGFLYLAPNESEILWALKNVSYIIIFVWILSAVDPSLLSVSEKVLNYRKSGQGTDIGFSVNGIRLVVFYFYYQLYANSFKINKKGIISISFLLGFIFLFQNRSLLIGLIFPFIHFLFTFKSRFKPIIFLVFIASIISVGIYYNKIINNLINETSSQLSNSDYARWRAFYYYFNEYSPDPICYIFGNGRISIHSEKGSVIKTLNSKGIYDSDIGMFGMLITYGIIPLFLIYRILFKVLFKKKYPNYLKYMSFHIVLVPTMFHFWDNPNILLFVLIFYLQIFYQEFNNLKFYE